MTTESSRRREVRGLPSVFGLDQYVCHIGFCNGGTIHEEEKKILLDIVAKKEEC